MVCLAAENGKLTKENVQDVMAPFYEIHCKVDNDRFDKMAEKGRVEAYRALSNDKIRKDIDNFKQQWGDSYTLNSSEYAKYGEERRKTLPVIMNNVMPDMFSVCGVYPKFEIETEKYDGRYACAWNTINVTKGELGLFFKLFLTDKACAH